MASRRPSSHPTPDVRRVPVTTECAECNPLGVTPPLPCRWDARDENYFCRACFDAIGQAPPDPEAWQPSVVCTRDQAFAGAVCARWRARIDAEPDARDSSPSLLLLGFDVEWRPNYVKGAVPNRVALVQLAEPGGEVVLTRLARAKTLHPAIVDLLTHARVVLVGVGVKEDVKKLTRDFAGCFAAARARRAAELGASNLTLRFADLGDVARAAARRFPDRESPGPTSGFGLKKLAAFHGVPMSHKTKALTMTNWEKPVLFPAEIAYAARDAESGLTIARAMCEREGGGSKKEAGAAVADQLEELGDGLARFLAPHVQFVPA